MTADVELLPLPEWQGDFMTESEFREEAQAYARACVSSATEALRAEVGELHMHAKRRDQYAVEKAAQALDWKERAERLAEALWEAEKSLRTIADCAGLTKRIKNASDVRGYANSRANAARAALEQETTNG